MKEIEATLIICAGNPLEVAADIAALPSIGGYSLTPHEPLTIHDYYVDTDDAALRHADFSLRLREINTAPWLTMKGPPRSIGPGIVERLEIELPWSRDSLECICQELAHHGIKTPKVPGFNESDPPDRVLSRMGLHLVQHRENHRQIRTVMRADAIAGPTLAELSIDSVVYHLEQHRIRHYEVEIEAKAESGVVALPEIVQVLLDTYPSSLQTWEHGKLSTGRAVETLLEQGALQDYINQQDQLMPSAYPKIHHFLCWASA